MAWAYAHPTFPYSHWRAQREPSCPAGLKGMTKHKLDPSVRKKGTEQPDARRKLLPLKVYCTKEERALIEGQAETAGMSVSEYLRNVGKGTPVKSRVDVQAIKALAKVNADLGRGLTQDASKKRGKAHWLFWGTTEANDQQHGRRDQQAPIFLGVDF